MNDREVFRKNLNYYLSITGKLQKDLAEYVGAKTTTVSGWTRGISYPRADAMEKIAMFFGIPTSKLVGSDEDTAAGPLSADDQARLEALHQDPRLGLLFDRTRRMTHDDVEFMIQFADRILDSKDNE